ncbi:hypothetical protein PHYPSEUDO_010260 [Phytophthora pseudosyringae]|uniref:Uncharacterized protein n=1 Tax=Phytophthora pseudosyringae TaxID=221518 RepID=A0A8T1VDI9_9STRA|nr:hypothetical protein PHYPSEUDO_010260 [Phytophthora pseudosyringae]
MARRMDTNNESLELTPRESDTSRSKAGKKRTRSKHGKRKSHEYERKDDEVGRRVRASLEGESERIGEGHALLGQETHASDATALECSGDFRLEMPRQKFQDVLAVETWCVFHE